MWFHQLLMSDGWVVWGVRGHGCPAQTCSFILRNPSRSSCYRRRNMQITSGLSLGNIVSEHCNDFLTHFVTELRSSLHLCSSKSQPFIETALVRIHHFSHLPEITPWPFPFASLPAPEPEFFHFRKRLQKCLCSWDKLDFFLTHQIWSQNVEQQFCSICAYFMNWTNIFWFVPHKHHNIRWLDCIMSFIKWLEGVVFFSIPPKAIHIL